MIFSRTEFLFSFFISLVAICAVLDFAFKCKFVWDCTYGMTLRRLISRRFHNFY